MTVVIPTHGQRGSLVSVLRKIFECKPEPAEVIVHFDGASQGQASDAAQLVMALYPGVKILKADARIGPGGGRHRGIQAATQPYVVSFDDDSFPLDPDFFKEVVRLFEAHADWAIIASQVQHPEDPRPDRTLEAHPTTAFVGCGHAIRVGAYNEVRGYLSRPVAYGIEESDLAIQLLASGWRLVATGKLRVYHATSREHHNSAEITAATIANLALLAYLHYPHVLWPALVLQLARSIADNIGRGRWRGIAKGLVSIPADWRRHTSLRHPVPAGVLLRLWRDRRTRSAPAWCR